jgi:hypothetical protein
VCAGQWSARTYKYKDWDVTLDYSEDKAIWPMKPKGYLTLEVVDTSSNIYFSKSVDHPLKPKQVHAACECTGVR